MPYKEIKVGNGKVEVVNSQTGRIHAKASTPKNASAQLRLLHAIDKNPNFKARSSKKSKRPMPHGSKSSY